MDNGPGGVVDSTNYMGCLYCRLHGKLQIAATRQVCYECHKKLRQMVKSGQATDEELVLKGYWRPSKMNAWKGHRGLIGK